MPLAAHQLDAFHAIAETGSFSRASERLHVTQPALSQRVQQLEGELKKRLFVRSPAGVFLTDAGTRLLRYCQVQRALEAELLDDLAVAEGEHGPSAPLSGTVRVAAFSSVARSCVVPALGAVFRANPRLVVDVAVREMNDIEALLTHGSVDFAVIDHAVERPDVVHVSLGDEELVLVESTTHRAREDVYLDHDPDDTTTLRFLKRNGVKATHVRRSFFDDVYGVLDGAVHGFGRAVVSKHLLENEYAKKLRVVPGMKPGRAPVVLHYFRQPAYTRAHAAVREALETGIAKELGSLRSLS
jgi:DNA-binding transcriptional LysR family regulator